MAHNLVSLYGHSTEVSIGIMQREGDINILVTHSSPNENISQLFQEEIDADQCRRKIHKMILRERKHPEDAMTLCKIAIRSKCR